MKKPRFVSFTSDHVDGVVVAVHHVVTFIPATDEDGGTWIHMTHKRSVWVMENWETVKERLEGHEPQ